MKTERTNSAAQESFDREIVPTRVFDAPREPMCKAFSEPYHFVPLVGPEIFTNTFHILSRALYPL